MKIFHSAALVALAFIIIGCQSDGDLRYLDASVGGRLDLPPDLIERESESGFDLPDTFSGDDKTVRNKVPVLARVESLRIEGSENLHWLSVEEPVDNIYQLVKDFWASEGYRLTVDEPIIGIMQTEWVLKEVGSTEKTGSWIERLFSTDDLSAVQDQFKTRIERGQQGRNRIYIAHRGAEYNFVLDKNDKSGPLDGAGSDKDSQWRGRQPDPELEIEMLSRLMIYLGLQKSQVDQQLAKVKLFKPRAFMQLDNEENSPFLIIKDPYHIAWNRVYHILDRLNFEVVSSQFKEGVFEEVGVFVVKIKVDDSREKGGLFSLGSAGEPREQTISLILSKENHEMTRVEIENEKGEIDTSIAGAEFLSLLYRQIK